MHSEEQLSETAAVLLAAEKQNLGWKTSVVFPVVLFAALFAEALEAVAKWVVIKANSVTAAAAVVAGVSVTVVGSDQVDATGDWLDWIAEQTSYFVVAAAVAAAMVVVAFVFAAAAVAVVAAAGVAVAAVVAEAAEAAAAGYFGG